MIVIKIKDFKEIVVEKLKDFISSFCISCKSKQKYIDYLEDNYHKVIYEFCNLSYIYDAERVIGIANERNDEHYRECYKSDIEDIIQDYVDTGSKEDLIADLRAYLEIDEEFIENKKKINAYWRDYFDKKDNVSE